MTRTKYQVFISSTYVDLIEERNHVIKAVLSMGHIPVGMEMFNAADDTQWKIIKGQIDQSDYYTLIVAHRYGSMVRGLSYTEKEYDYAVEQGIPVIGFVIDDHASWPSDRIEQGDAVRAKLKKFKTKVKKKPVAFWSNGLELGGKFTAAFATLINTNPRPGWVRGTETTGADVTNELGRLSKENSDLRAEIIRVKSADDAKLERALTWINKIQNIHYSGRGELTIEGFRPIPETGTVQLFWYDILDFLFRSSTTSFSGEDVLDGLSKIVSNLRRTTTSTDPSKATSYYWTVDDAEVSTIAEVLMSHRIVHPLPLGEAKNCTWHFSENAGFYRDLITQIMAGSPP